jgi:phenylpyruvate tautomerase PptA (4-oxalocrotonate tautomerase family)
MPLIKVQSSVKSPDSQKINELLKTLSSKLATDLGKPESYVMTSFEPEIAMTFGGSDEPVCYVEIKNIGTMKPDLTKAMSKDFCQEINEFLGVAKNRIYIEFADAKGYMWGWDSRTF